MILQLDIIDKQSGIYCVIHRASGMCYVGSSVDMGRRRKTHLWASTLDKHKSIFYRAIREFGAESFDFEVLEFCSKEKLLEREKFWIIFMGSASIGDLNTLKNPTAIYDRVTSEVTRQRQSAAQKGRVHSKEALEKMRQARTGKKLSKEHVEKLRVSHLGKSTGPCTEDRKRKISEANKGRIRGPISEKHKDALRAKKGVPKKPFSEEHKRNISLAATGRKRGPYSAEHIEKIRQGNLGKKMSEETREKMRLAKKGKPLSAEHKLKLAGLHKGRTHSEESKAKMRESRRIREEIRKNVTA